MRGREWVWGWRWGWGGKGREGVGEGGGMVGEGVEDDFGGGLVVVVCLLSRLFINKSLPQKALI